MSIRLRIRYQLRSFIRTFLSIRFPTFLTGTASKAVLSVIIIFLLVGYIAEISNLTTSGYQIATLEKKVSVLTNESSQLNAEVASFQSIASIQKRLQGVVMEPVKNISYIKVSPMTVAER